ncbi:MAG: RNA repair domain-containing protein [Acidobacteriota bacterium]
MPVRTVRELLNRLRWDLAATAVGVVLEVRSREGGGEVIEAVRFEEVTDILPAGVVVADGTFLPYHRLVTVRRGDEVLWRAHERGGEGEARR